MEKVKVIDSALGIPLLIFIYLASRLYDCGEGKVLVKKVYSGSACVKDEGFSYIK